MGMKNKKLFKTLIYIVIIIAFTLPSLVIAMYSYPAQDDFHYAYFGRKLMQEGHGLISMSVIKTIEYYKGFCGCYTSSFLGYFFSGIINCNIIGIRIYEVLSAIFFYFSLFCFIHALVKGIMKQEFMQSLNVYILMLACFNCLIYYIEHEDFYWFITSVQYLTISSFILLGVSFFIKAVKSCKLGDMMVAITLGILGSGGALNIAAFCCVIHLLVGLWAIFDQKQITRAIIIFGITLTGAVINGIAPGNYIRKGQSLGIWNIIQAIELSIKYAYERISMLMHNSIFIIIIILLITCAATWKKKEQNYKYYCPISFTIIMFACVAVVIFPVMIGYGWDTYQVLCRGNFISDMAIYLFLLITILYWKGWISQNIAEIQSNPKNIRMIRIAIAGLICILAFQARWDEIPFIRETREIVSGECKRYSDFCIDIYNSIEEADGDVAELTVEQVEDNTCMINPQFYYGYYDPEKEYANTTIARFYNKKAVYLININNANTIVQ